jgi:hypothetical protein
MFIVTPSPLGKYKPGLRHMHSVNQLALPSLTIITFDAVQTITIVYICQQLFVFVTAT